MRSIFFGAVLAASPLAASAADMPPQFMLTATCTKPDGSVIQSAFEHGIVGLNGGMRLTHDTGYAVQTPGPGLKGESVSTGLVLTYKTATKSDGRIHLEGKATCNELTGFDRVPGTTGNVGKPIVSGFSQRSLSADVAGTDDPFSVVDAGYKLEIKLKKLAD